MTVDNPELEVIKRKTLRAGELAKRSIQMSVDAILFRDPSLCNHVGDIEREVDFLNVDVEESCLKVLSLGNLSERTFRLAATLIDVSSRFERITDLGSEICDYFKRGLPKPLLKPFLDLQKMNEAVHEMIDIDLRALSKDLTVSVEEMKNKQGDMVTHYEAIYRDIVSYVHQHPASFDDAILMVSILGNLVRIGELAMKIGNRIIYIVEDRRIWLDQ